MLLLFVEYIYIYICDWARHMHIFIECESLIAWPASDRLCYMYVSFCFFISFGTYLILLWEMLTVALDCWSVYWKCHSYFLCFHTFVWQSQQHQRPKKKRKKETHKHTHIHISRNETLFSLIHIYNNTTHTTHTHTLIFSFFICRFSHQFLHSNALLNW